MRSSHGDRLAGLLGHVLMLVMALLVLWAPAPWFHDLNEWLFQAKVLALKITAPEQVSAFVVAPYPVPSALALAVLALFALAMPLLWAGKLFVIAQLAGWIWLVRAWTQRVVPADCRGSVAAVLYAMAALSSFFWYGFINYQLGLLLLMACLLYCRSTSPGWQKALWGVALLSCHAAIVLVWGWLILLWSLHAAWPLRSSSRHRLAALWRQAWPLLPALLFAAWYALGRFGGGYPSMEVQAVTSGLGEALLYKLGYPLMLGGFRNILLPDGRAVFESLPWLYWAGLTSNALLIVLLGLWGLQTLRGAFGDGGSTAGIEGKARLAATLILVLLYAIAPYHFFGLVNGAGRLVLPLILLALLIPSAQALRWWRWAAWPALLGSALSLLGYGLLIADLPAGVVAHRMEFVPVDIAPADSVFAFNDAAYANTRFRYLNYRVLMGSERVQQALDGQLSGIGNVTSLLVDYRAEATDAAGD